MSERPLSRVDQFNQSYMSFLRLLGGVSDVVLGVMQTLILSVGLPILLVLLVLVEIQRLQHGIELFESNPTTAWLAALTLVLANLALELLVVHIEIDARYVEHRQQAWSLRLMWQQLAYKLGWQAEWRPRDLSPAAGWQGLLNLTGTVILLLALAGSMTKQIRGLDGNWVDGLRAIVERSSLLDMLTWLGGGLFALVVVLLAQRIARFVAMRTLRTLKEIAVPQTVPEVVVVPQTVPEVVTLELVPEMDLSPKVTVAALDFDTAENRTHRHCKNCGRYIDHLSRQAKYCSDACKSQFNKNRTRLTRAVDGTVELETVE